MKVLVTNNYFGTPILWEYDEGIVERIDLFDFNTHTLLTNDSPDLSYPLDLADKILMYVFNYRLTTRNFAQAFQICQINRHFARKIYKKIYDETCFSLPEMIRRLGMTFRLAENIYDDYLCEPNPQSHGLTAISLTRLGSLRTHRQFDPWDFIPQVDIQKLAVEIEEMNVDLFAFPGQFYGDTIWIRGSEDDGIYDVNTIQHPIIVLILCDYTYALIPTLRSINRNWRRFVMFLRSAFGPKTGVSIMVKSDRDIENPFIETTDMFLQI
jgi:hypothetical protein